MRPLLLAFLVCLARAVAAQPEPDGGGPESSPGPAAPLSPDGGEPRKSPGSAAKPSPDGGALRRPPSSTAKPSPDGGAPRGSPSSAAPPTPEPQESPRPAALPSVDGGQPARAGDDSATVLERARSYFTDLLAARVREVVDQSELPFFLEGRKINTAEELFQEWTRNLGPKRVDLLKLYGIEVLTTAEMESKYGPPPARLGSFPWNSAHAYVAIGNLSGRAAIVLFRRGRGGWRAVAYHD